MKKATFSIDGAPGLLGKYDILFKDTEWSASFLVLSYTITNFYIIAIEVVLYETIKNSKKYKFDLQRIKNTLIFAVL
jgi:hypothetical protein